MDAISRHQFLRLAAAGLGAAAAVQLLAGCGRTPAAADPPSPSPALAPSAPPPPTTAPTPPPSPLPAGITPSPSIGSASSGMAGRVVRARHAGVWQGDSLDPAAIRAALDAGIRRLTGVDEAGQAWAGLFDASERIAIKVNAEFNGSTHVPLVEAVIERLQEIGVPADHITLYDRATDELANAGFPANKKAQGVRCFGSDGRFASGWQIEDKQVRLSHILAECDALINMPVLKAFTMGGMSFAMKNHYGSFDTPYRFHDAQFGAGIVGLNGLPPIKDRTRLIVGDVLAAASHRDFTDYVVIGTCRSILLSRDPVATDTVGLYMALDTLRAEGAAENVLSGRVADWAARWLPLAAGAGLGTTGPDQIELIEENL